MISRKGKTIEEEASRLSLWARRGDLATRNAKDLLRDDTKILIFTSFAIVT